MDTDELTPEAFDKLKERVQVLEEMIFVEMKLTADRTDISACAKVDKIKAFIEQLRDDGTEEEVEVAKDEQVTSDISATGANPMGNLDPKVENNVATNLKRLAPDTAEADESKEAKAARLAAKVKELEGEGDVSDEEGADAEVDCCVVCGLHRAVFKEDTGRELHHYLSHGFNILKEFDILKPDDSLFLICNICNSPFPRKCHVNFRKHLVGSHKERIIEIFREV